MASRHFTAGTERDRGMRNDCGVGEEEEEEEGVERPS